jgi:O-acetyl-ADP-ribose deacetylase (regulator of RNase III)
MYLKNTQVFISYKKKNQQTPPLARSLKQTLEGSYGYQVFLDIDRIPTAAEWAKHIYENIHRSDVLIVLLEPETATSEWIQREIDVARGAHVSILPLAVVDPRQIDLSVATEKLAIANLQYSQHFQGSADDFERLVGDIERLTKITRDAQKQWMTETQERWRVRPPRDHHSKYRSFPLDDSSDPRCVHLAVGDIFAMGSFDVIVNTENTYMQMARYYEYNTLSSKLRVLGSKLDAAGRIVEDSVQDELDAQIARMKIGRPVEARQVIVTHAGHEHSKLREVARYLFHAATVRIFADDANVKTAPISPDGIRQTTFNCLEKTIEFNQQQGASLSKKPSTNLYESITSIIFPIFGTGQGGVPVLTAAPAMAHGIYDFVTRYGQHPQFTLRDIHLCVYSVAEVESVETALQGYFAVPVLR